MPRGKKPKPVALKILNGNPGKRPLPKEPDYGADAPSCPSHLDREAKAEWKRIVGPLTRAGVLAVTDRAALASYCQLWSRVVMLEKIVQKSGVAFIDEHEKRHYAKGGDEVVQTRVKFYRSPYAIELHGCYDQMKTFLVEFGLTPSSRARLAAPAASHEDDELALFMGAAK